MNDTSTGDGKVAVYRWFENGEGWAYHPWYDPRGLELSRAVDAILKGGPGGPFCIAALGGYLVGEHRDDPLCPDPKARDRRPTILHTIFVSRRPVEADQSRLLEALRLLPLPRQRREDVGLTLSAELCRSLIPPSTPSNGEDAAIPFKVPDSSHDTPPAPGSFMTRRTKRAMLILVLALMPLLVGWLVAGYWKNHDDAPRPRSHTDDPSGNKDSTTQPQPTVSDEPGITLETLTAERFRKALGSYAKVDHPYVAYLNAQAERLPERSLVFADRDQLRKLRPDLLAGLSPDVDVRNLSDEALAAAIAGDMSYENWREGPGKRAFQDRHKPLPVELRGFVERFRQPLPALRRDAVAMAELLHGWGEREPSTQYAERHPFAVFDRFFAFLTRPRFVPRPLSFDHPKTAFLWRLPADPVGEGTAYDSEEDLEQSLRRLLYHLERNFNPYDDGLSVPALLQRVGDTMRYQEWRRSEGRRAYVDEAKDPGPEVNQFVARFTR